MWRRIAHNDLIKLKRSRFRRGFHLSETDRRMIFAKGIKTIEAHAHDIVTRRLKNPTNNKRLTPYAGHPVFVAQHATATCCRNCIQKWHRIPKNKTLNETEIIFIKNIIITWIYRDLPYTKQTRNII